MVKPSYADLEAKGDDAVWLNLSRNRYNIDQRHLAEHWLHRKERERDSARDASNDATAALARRANRIATAAAIIATICTVITTVVSVMAYLKG